MNPTPSYSIGTYKKLAKITLNRLKRYGLRDFQNVYNLTRRSGKQLDGKHVNFRRIIGIPIVYYDLEMSSNGIVF